MAQPDSFAKGTCQHCGGHIEFPVRGAGQKISCPHCNWPTVLLENKPAAVKAGGASMARKRAIISVAIAAALLAVAGGAYIYRNANRSTTVNVRKDDPELTMSASSAKTDTHPYTAANDAAISTNGGSNSVPSIKPKPKPPVDPWHGLKPGQVTLEKTGESHLIYAVGTLTNDTTRQRFGVKVELDVLDEHRNKLGRATDYTEVIEPGKAWKFRALVTAKTATTVKLINVKESE